ncbi:MAG: hypothetical protein ACRDTH_00260 [Pseudonocardiaceae bacterium]
MAAVTGCDTTTVESYFRDTWHVHHDGTLPTLASERPAYDWPAG